MQRRLLSLESAAFNQFCNSQRQRQYKRKEELFRSSLISVTRAGPTAAEEEYLWRKFAFKLNFIPVKTLAYFECVSSLFLKTIFFKLAPLLVTVTAFRDHTQNYFFAMVLALSWQKTMLASPLHPCKKFCSVTQIYKRVSTTRTICLCKFRATSHGSSDYRIFHGRHLIFIPKKEYFLSVFIRTHLLFSFVEERQRL